MLNLTAGAIVFNRSDSVLNVDIRAALLKSADATLSAHGLEKLDLSKVTTKTNLVATFPKFVRLSVLADDERIFGREYVELAFSAYCQKRGYLTEGSFISLMFPSSTGLLKYKKSYAIAIRPSLGLFLLALHCSGGITLPAGFPWPWFRKRREGALPVCSELLHFIRGLDSKSESQSHPALNAVGGDSTRKEWFRTYGTKLLLATGWQTAEDVNIGDLIKLKGCERALSANGKVLPFAYNVLLDVLKRAYGDRVRATVEEWTQALRTDLVRGTGSGPSSAEHAIREIFSNARHNDKDLVEVLLGIEPLWGRPEQLKTLLGLPGLEVDLVSLSELWIKLEELYIEKTPRESYRAIRTIFGWWNIYLFYYLPTWFARNSDTKLTFPSNPSLLLKSIFFSRLLPTQTTLPVTFIEFMNAQQEYRNWTNNSYYGSLLQLEQFFRFIELHSDEIPGCEGFTQPISPHDYPKTSRQISTNKRPIPRRLFGIYLDYHEALIAHLGVIGQRILSGELDVGSVNFILKNEQFIDTFATANLVGFVPVIFTKIKTIRLQIIPYILDIGLRTLKDGRTISLPHPHAIYQNLTVLHTGLRHNHIQWLDRKNFDSSVGANDKEFTKLFVNTDKQKKRPWTPDVCMRVIELLRAQNEWFELIDEPGFDAFHYYNDNPSTKWAKLKPLFAYTKSGKPHHDNVYSEIWQKVLCGIQGLLPELSEYGEVPPLLRLLPPGHRPDDEDLSDKLRRYGATFGMGEFCPLRVMTEITPHSARVSVVSQYITFLPADLIGQKITGQTERVVQYYVHLDKETVEAEQVHQAARLRDVSLRNALEPALGVKSGGSTFIHADSVNSNLARSMRTNLDETLVSYGCISIMLTEAAMSGVDVLRETRGAEAVANKTEICPYGNNCPPEIIKKLKGIRRCGLCNYAVRNIDHLPAVMAKTRQVAELVDELETLLSVDSKTLNAKYTPAEIDRLEDERERLCEELTGWVLNGEVLEVTRQRIAAGQDSRAWVVQKPEIIERDLRLAAAPTSTTAYLLARLGECIAYPTLESPQIRARFELLRRELLARAGNLRAAFSSDISIDPAAECAGLLKAVIASTGLSAPELVKLLEEDSHMQSLPQTPLRLLNPEE